jgi:uncharacterized protein YegP (UPF0339 family)
MADKFEIYKDTKGEFGWRLKSANGQTIATGGEGYASKSGCENGIAAVKRDSPQAAIEDAWASAPLRWRALIERCEVAVSVDQPASVSIASADLSHPDRLVALLTAVEGELDALGVNV